jgi:hypothetical protein
MQYAGGVPPGTTAVTDIDLKLDDSAANLMPNGTQLKSGSYRPTDFLGTGLREAGPGPYSSTLTGTAAPALVLGADPAVYNGIWTLYVKDLQLNDSGAIARGWSLTLSEEINTPSTAPESMPTCATLLVSALGLFAWRDGGRAFPVTPRAGDGATGSAP